MGLEDRIKEGMYVDTESLLDDEFDRAQELFDIYEDHTVAVSESVLATGREEVILAHLVAWQYIAEANDDQTAGLSYDYFYERIDASESTIRGDFSDFVDAGLVRENGEGNKELVVEQLSEALRRIEDAREDDES